MLTPKKRLAQYRNNISKQTKPFVAQWGRKLTTKERDMLEADPWQMFKPSGCWVARFVPQNLN
jgi:hypothetical protein